MYVRHICLTYTPYGKAVSGRRHTGIAGTFQQPRVAEIPARNDIDNETRIAAGRFLWFSREMAMSKEVTVYSSTF